MATSMGVIADIEKKVCPVCSLIFWIFISVLFGVAFNFSNTNIRWREVDSIGRVLCKSVMEGVLLYIVDARLQLCLTH